MNTHSAPPIEEATRAYNDAYKQHGEAVTAFTTAHETLSRVTLRRDRMRAMIAAADTESAAHKAEWVRRLREDDGELSPEVKKLRKLQRDGEELASEYRDMLDESLIAHQQAEIDALLAARNMDERRRAALIKLSELELARALEESVSGFARAFALATLAHEQSPVVDRRFSQGRTVDEKAMATIVSAITAQAKSAAQANAMPRGADDLPADLAKKRDITPLSWDDTESQITLHRKQAAVAAKSAA